MDPISIAAAVGSASSTAWRISLTLYTFISSAKKVDRSIDMLYAAIQGLETAIKNVETTLREPVVRTATTHRQDHDELLLGIEQSIKDCQQTLDATDEQLSNVGPSSKNSSIWRKSLLQLNLNLAEPEINTLRLHIQSHCTSLQIALHSLTLSINCRTSQGLSHDFHTRFDQLAKLIENLDPIQVGKISQELPPSFQNADLSSHTSQLIEKARAVVSDASIVLSRESSTASSATVKTFKRKSSDHYSSVAPLDEHSRARIQNWIPDVWHGGSDTSSHVFEETNSTDERRNIYDTKKEKDVPGSTSSDECESEDEFEVDALRYMLKNGTELMSRGKYQEAERFIERGLDGARHLNGKARDTFQLQEHQLQLALVNLYQGKVESALPDLQSLAHGRSRTKQEASLVLQASYGLCQVYCCSGDYDRAENVCRNVIKGWIKILGKQNTLYVRSLRLQSYINEQKGEKEKASAYSALAEATDITQDNDSELRSVFEGPSTTTIERLSRIIDEEKRKRIKSATASLHSLIEDLPALDSVDRRHLDEVLRSQFLSVLLDKPDLEAQLESGLTPLQSTIHRRQIKVANILIDGGANVNGLGGTSALVADAALKHRAHPHESPLYHAIDSQDLPMIKLLVAKGADVTLLGLQGHGPIHAAISVVQDFRTRPDPNTVSNFDAVVDALIRGGADINLLSSPPSRERLSPLLHAVNYRFKHDWTERVIRGLLKAGADINLKSPLGYTPLAFAIKQCHNADDRVRHSNRGMVTLLMQNGADPQASLTLRAPRTSKSNSSDKSDITYESHIAYARSLGVKGLFGRTSLLRR